MHDFDLIETPENVELRRCLAGIGSRFIAGFLDNLLIFLMYLFLFLLFLLLGNINILDDVGVSSATERWALAGLILVAFSIYWGYFALFEAWTNGQSPGKKYMKIRVVQIEGEGISFNSIAIRNLLRAVDAIGLYAVGGMVMFVTKKVQRLGDLAAGTVVISEEMPNYSAHYDKKKQLVDNQAATSIILEATGLTPEEYQLLHNYWLRREELNIEARGQLLPQLVRPILNRIGQSLPDASPATFEKYVDEMMAKAENAEREARRKVNESEGGE
ncbi:MAG: RDD family protein [Sedimentisphaerales bacterium]|nr:RDD family protein [Sedimentisphaerales bacterium]